MDCDVDRDDEVEKEDGEKEEVERGIVTGVVL